jgi:Na+-transporting NADH:ubiquinone oxidoreductase subunit NqrC
MNWLARLLISNWPLVLVPIVLLGVWLSGVWVGEGRTQRAWDTERHQVALAQARAEQKSADIKRSQEQINHEISNEFNQRSEKLAADFQSGSFVRVRSNSADSVGRVSAISETPRSIAEVASDPIPATSGNEKSVSCEQLSKDAVQTTLMLLEIQRWYQLQSKNLQ